MRCGTAGIDSEESGAVDGLLIALVLVLGLLVWLGNRLDRWYH